MSEATVGDTSRYPLSALPDRIPWVRSAARLTEPYHDERFKIETDVSVVRMNRHPHTLENLGYSVERIGFDPPYGCAFFCNGRDR